MPRPFLILPLLLILAPATAAKAHEWISTAQSGYSSSYHTQAWFDSLYVAGQSPESLSWQLTHRLDLLRKERVSGADLRQRSQRASLQLEPTQSRPLNWVLHLNAVENAFEESIARRSILSQALGGIEWNPDPAARVTAEVGVVGSHHSSNESTTDAGFAERVDLHWDAARSVGVISEGIRADANLSHSGDHRENLPARETDWVWRSSWSHPEDTLTLDWLEDWGDTRFYPSPDRFEEIGRQKSRNRSAVFRWNRTPSELPSAGLLDPGAVMFRLRLEASANDNTYQMGQGSPSSLPNDTRSSARGYQLEGSREWHGVRFGSMYRYRWTKDRYGETRRDQTGETGEWTASMEVRLTRSDSLGARAIFRATTYAVPGDSSFFDDRDQGERVVELWWKRRVSEVLSIRPQFSFRSFRQVFISEQLSANNNTDDVYLLAPSILWSPTDRIEVAQQFAVRAHYRYFEYERTDPQGRGTLYRKAESISGVRLTASAHTDWHLGYVYRYEDFGGLYDREGWVQAVDWDRRSHLVDIHLNWEPSPAVSIDPEFGLEYKRSFDHRRDGDAIIRVEEDLFRRHYVALNVSWHSRRGIHVETGIARRVQRFGSAEKDRDDRWQLTLMKDL